MRPTGSALAFLNAGLACPEFGSACELGFGHLALGIPPDGTRDILGLWIENTEGAKFWMKVFNDSAMNGISSIGAGSRTVTSAL